MGSRVLKWELLVMPSSTWQTGGPWHSFGSPLCGSSVPSLPLVACREVKHKGYQLPNLAEG